ncbi:hypothetical protein [Aureispira anguillae]|uniref:Outer membrane protein beta-barrel domain-containing protein n=1 Tax=Aureispira anguillae TaxID=2864201 RepID=A0A915YBY7_9BACT|nr:hypothetical protein [Aureispira anguillae]BDS10275.1 hypothetical protein AsAng_0009830 [Aureispira anguillae]
MKRFIFILVLCSLSLKCFAQQDSINQYRIFKSLLLGGQVGYSYEKNSFLTLGGGAFYMGGLLAVEAGYKYKMAFAPIMNGHEIYFDLGIGLPPYSSIACNYLMLGAVYNTVLDEVKTNYQYIRPEVGLLIPGGVILKTKSLSNKANTISFTIKASYGYNIFLKNQTTSDLGNHVFSIGVLIGYGITL